MQSKAFIAIAACLVSLTATYTFVLPQFGKAGSRSQEALGTATIAPSRTFINLQYAGNENPRQSLDLFLPEPSAKPAPLVVFIHGGGWEAGSKDTNPARPLVSYGYAVASINYRLTNEVHWPEQIYDCKAAIRWLRSNAGKYGIDPSRIGVWGASAGGHLAALLGTSGATKELEGSINRETTSSDVQAVVDWFGPTDFVLYASEPHAPNEYVDNVLTKFFNGDLKSKPAEARAASPVTYASKDDPPFLIVHGDQDNVVPLSQSEQLQKKLSEAGVKSTLSVVKGAGHGNFASQYYLDVLKFFDKYLKS